MFRTLKYKQGIIAAIVLSLLLIFGVGYFFAVRKSEPEYRNKIEKIMFDSKNRAPKFIITLPDYKVRKIEKNKKETKEKQQKKDSDGLTPQQRVLANIPLLTKLTPRENAEPLKVIDLSVNLTQEEGTLSVPKKDGALQPWQVYGKKVSILPNFYRVAVVFKNFGLDKNSSEAISKGLPENISFSYSPYGTDLSAQIKAARRSGHETYVDLLLSSKDFLSVDTGPLAMDITVSEEELIARLKQTVSAGAPVGGIIINDGETGTDSLARLKKVLTKVSDMGLLAIDATFSGDVSEIKIPGLARNRADIVIDSGFNPEDIGQKLELAEQIAENKGQVIIVADPKPVVVLQILKWAESFSPQLSYEEMKAQNITAPEKPFALVPLSNTVIE